ncbi:MAG: hypothetical protein ABSH34_01210 [Verrucomicrobiota bacterium]|jgi:hypothetical protein
MKPTIFSNCIRSGLGAGLLLGAGLVARADTLVTFQVDLTAQINLGNFSLATGSVSARGSFNSWGELPLTNNSSASNPNLFTGTADDTADANGGTLQYKYYIDPSTWESPTSTQGGNRTATLPATGGTLVLPVVYFNDLSPSTPTNNVTFQVDMTEQVFLGDFDPTIGDVFCPGAFEGWVATGFLLTNNFAGSNTNLYSGTYPVVADVGAGVQYKFYYNPGQVWESPFSTGGNNRSFTVAGGDQTLPVVYFNDKPPGIRPVTNEVTFQVDMSAQILSGGFVPSVNTIECRGPFTSWSDGFTLTNDPAASNPNIYSGVWTFSDAPGTAEQYKFCIPPSGWEQPTSTGGNNRSFNLAAANGPLVLPVLFFSDLNVDDLLSTDTLVTFSVSMTNAVGTDSHVFDPTTDGVYMNGYFLGQLSGGSAGWLSWSQAGLAAYQLTNASPSLVYSITLDMPKGDSLALTYKYSINGSDNEAASGSNHVRYVRAVGQYALPLDQFGQPYVEPSFGNLKASLSTPGHVLVSWLGRPGVHLQTLSSLGSGAWQDHPETDGLMSTNWPAASGSLFFRLIKP